MFVNTLEDEWFKCCRQGEISSFVWFTEVLYKYWDPCYEGKEYLGDCLVKTTVPSSEDPSMHGISYPYEKHDENPEI